MADLGLAASITGLVSLGITITQGLNAYISSARGSKGRIKAIATDVQLTIDVVEELQRCLLADAFKADVTAGSHKVGKEVIDRCRGLFEAIKHALPETTSSGPRKRDIVTWPFTERTLELQQRTLEQVKATLLLWLQLVTLAAMHRKSVELILRLIKWS